jgi:hypothetical protein
MHGMLASFSEYYSRNLSAEVIKGSNRESQARRDAQHGPPGLLEHDRARRRPRDPHRRRRFRQGTTHQLGVETYASGLYSLSDMEVLLEARGLRTRGNRRWAPRPLSIAAIHTMLRCDYYTGLVTHRGQKYPGRHQPLVSRETFDQVQAVLTAHNRSGERDRKHSHYLKIEILRIGPDEVERQHAPRITSGA